VRFEPLSELNTDADEALPRLSRDELSIYFYREDDDGSTHILEAARPTTTAPFGKPSTLFSGIEGARQASPSANLLRVYFGSGEEPLSLRLAERASVDAPFATSKIVVDAGANGYSTPVLMEPPGARARLFVARTRADDADLWSAEIDDTGAPGEFTPVSGVNSPSLEYDPTPSADGLTLYFYSEVGSPDGQGRVFVSHRATLDDPFGAPAPVPEIERPPNGWVAPGALSVDGCRLYYQAAKEVDGPTDLFVASRSH
jgi:hypothetical protein